jgi:hypothetical protein
LAKRSILDAGISSSFRDPPAFELPDLLWINVYNGAEHSHQRCESVARHQYGQPNDEDTDAGPYQVWRTENAAYDVAESFWLSNDWLRKCAYVLWDSDRVQKMGGFRKEGSCELEDGVGPESDGPGNNITARMA